MARHYEDSQQPSSSKSRRQQEDQRRMAFRRAIENHCEARRLDSETADFPDLKYWQEVSPAGRQSVPPAH